MRDYLHLYVSLQSLFSSRQALLNLASQTEAQLLGTRRRAFSTATPHLGNGLPKEACLAPYLEVFKKTSDVMPIPKAGEVELDLEVVSGIL